MMLSIENLSVQRDEKLILHQVSLSIPKGEIHALMGPNGSGKSTLALSLAGNPSYQITEGKVLFNEEDLLALTPELRAQKGLFLSFQNPVEIPGINNRYFLRTAYQAIQEARGLKDIDPGEFISFLKEKTQMLNLPEKLLDRNLNEGFSGGEKKFNEILQMLVLSPTFIVLDEIDSGLDLDALNKISDIITQFHDKNRSFLIISHYPRLLEKLTLHKIHIMQNGKIVHSGNKQILSQLEKGGYAQFSEGGIDD